MNPLEARIPLTIVEIISLFRSYDDRYSAERSWLYANTALPHCPVSIVGDDFAEAIRVIDPGEQFIHVETYDAGTLGRINVIWESSDWRESNEKKRTLRAKTAPIREAYTERQALDELAASVAREFDRHIPGMRLAMQANLFNHLSRVDYNRGDFIAHVKGLEQAVFTGLDVRLLPSEYYNNTTSNESH